MISPFKHIIFSSVRVKNTFSPPGGIPENFALSNLTPVSLDIDWDAVVGATSYQLQRADNEEFSNFVIVYNGSNNSFTDITIAPITTYYYRVRVIISGVPGDFTDPENITTIQDNSYSGVYPMIYT